MTELVFEFLELLSYLGFRLELNLVAPYLQLEGVEF